MFHAKAVGDELSEELVAHEMELIGAPAGGACAGGEPCGCGH
jgi:hypothetical protein